MSNLKTEFEKAREDVENLGTRPDDDTLLELYSLYKQATDGDVAGDRPGPFDFVRRAKFDAWASRKGMSQSDAMKAYVKLVRHLASK